MTKRQMIDEILAINTTAEPAFLARFGDTDLDEYLEHLRLIQMPRLSGDSSRYARYFENCPKIAAAVPVEQNELPPYDAPYDIEPYDASAEAAVRPEQPEPVLVGVAASAETNELTSFASSEENSASWLF